MGFNTRFPLQAEPERAKSCSGSNLVCVLVVFIQFERLKKPFVQGRNRAPAEACLLLRLASLKALGITTPAVSNEVKKTVAHEMGAIYMALCFFREARSVGIVSVVSISSFGLPLRAGAQR